MNFSTTLVIGILTFVATAYAEECSTTQFLTIAGSVHLEGCTSDIGFRGFEAMSTLSEDQIVAVCVSPQCLKLMDEMRSMNLGDCIIQGTNVALDKDFLDPFKKRCGGGDVANSSSTDGIGSSVITSSSVTIKAALELVGLTLLTVLLLSF
ncbi:hypothetical protein CCR75_002531 [Bremia lactucae]|uniref:Elicitin n=1 Tax=Bremia lactucae TaxID=4779 RepID=A0A976NZ08_BRELC|nr:hypothetical protein CCR75_002531 [Bremia lactucae]